MSSGIDYCKHEEEGKAPTYARKILGDDSFAAKKIIGQAKRRVAGIGYLFSHAAKSI